MNFDCVRIQNALAKNEAVKLSDEAAQHLSACAAALAARQGMKSALQKALANDAAAPVALRARIRRELQQPQTHWRRVLAWFAGLNLLPSSFCILLQRSTAKEFRMRKEEG